MTTGRKVSCMESYAIVGLGTVRIQCVVYLRLKCGTVVQHGSNLKRFLGSSDRTLSLSLRGAPFCQGWGAGADRAGDFSPGRESMHGQEVQTPSTPYFKPRQVCTSLSSAVSAANASEDR